MEEAITEHSNYDDPKEEFLDLNTMPSTCGKYIDNVPTMRDVSTSNAPRMKSVRTQYYVSHYKSKISGPIECQSKRLLVKIPPRRKQKDAEVNTILSFKPNDVVVMTIIKQDELSEENVVDIDNVQVLRNA